MSRETGNCKSIISVIGDYSCYPESVQIDRAVQRLEMVLAARTLGQNFEQLESSIMSMFTNPMFITLQNNSFHFDYNRLGKNLLNMTNYKFLSYILFAKIVTPSYEWVGEILREKQLQMKNIDRNTTNVYSKVLAEIMDHECIQISLLQMLKSKINIRDFIYYLDRQKGKREPNILLLKLIDLLPKQYAFDILNECITYAREWDPYMWVDMFIQCGGLAKMDVILMRQNLNQQIKKQSVQFLSNFHRLYSFLSYLELSSLLCPINGYKTLNILKQLIKHINTETSEIAKWSFNAVVNMMVCTHNSHNQMFIDCGIIPVLSQCLKRQQYLRHSIDCIDILLFMGDINGNDGENKFLQYFKNYNIDSLLRKLDGDTFDAIGNKEYISQYANCRDSVLYNNFEDWRDRVIYEYFTYGYNANHLLLTFGYVRHITYDKYIPSDLIKMIQLFIPKPLLFDIYNKQCWKLSLNKRLITFISHYNDVDNMQLIYLNDTGYDRGIHYFSIKSREYPWFEESYVGIVQQRKKQWIQNADDLFPICDENRFQGCYFFTIQNSENTDYFDRDFVDIAIKLDCDKGTVSYFQNGDVKQKQIGKD
eukprot:305206_1